MRKLWRSFWATALLASGSAFAQTRATVRVHISAQGASVHVSDKTTVAWLEPIGTSATFSVRSHYTLLQKNRMFTPHIQVIPVGATVDFPNADPFFHNVFSLFDGRRFDLGLYEAGSSKSILFPREGVSYIFCNIHPEMSAVIVTLATPYYGVSRVNNATDIVEVPVGSYTLHVWVEGVPQYALNSLAKRVEVSASGNDLGTVVVPLSAKPDVHMNKFGKPYIPEPHSTY